MLQAIIRSKTFLIASTAMAVHYLCRNTRSLRKPLTVNVDKINSFIHDVEKDIADVAGLIYMGDRIPLSIVEHELLLELTERLKSATKTMRYTNIYLRYHNM